MNQKEKDLLYGIFGFLTLRKKDIIPEGSRTHIRFDMNRKDVLKSLVDNGYIIMDDVRYSSEGVTGAIHTDIGLTEKGRNLYTLHLL